MTTATATKVPALKESVLAKSALIEAALTVDVTTGIAPAEADVYENSLKADGKDLETAIAYAEHDVEFIAASVHAVGQIGIKAMSENKDLNSVETQIRMAGKNTLDIEVERTRVFTNPKDKDAPVTKHGVTTINYSVAADNTGGGQLKIARATINNLAADSLK